jgi:preprotein translocase subunit SecB
MIDFTALQDVASRLVPHASLHEIKLFGMQARHQAFAQGESDPWLSDLSVRLESSESGSSSLAFVLVVSTELLEQQGDAEAEPRVLAELEVAYGALYGIDEAAGEITPAEREAFGYTVAAMTVWPYIRAVVSRTLADMNFGASILIPTVTQREIAEAAAASRDAQIEE